MKHRLPKFLFIRSFFSLVISAYLFITLPFLGFFLGANYQETLDKYQRQPDIYSFLAPKNLATAYQVSSWQDYIDPQTRLAFQYPSNWIIIDNNPQVIRIIPNLNNQPQYQSFIIISSFSNPLNLSIDDFKYTNSFTNPDKNYIVYYPTTFAGSTAERGVELQSSTISDNILVNHNGQIYQILRVAGPGIQVSDQVFQRFVSSFHFLI